MADNYTQFSHGLFNLTKPEIKWFQKVLELYPDNSNSKDEKTLRKYFPDLDVSCGWPEFEYEIDEAGRSLHIYSEDTGNVEHAVELIYAFIRKFRKKDIIAFSASYTCSKPKIDEFGGETFVISEKGIHSNQGLPVMMSRVLETGKTFATHIGSLNIIVAPMRGK